jgi:cobalt-zinc-cadmium efflux system membrane fusion protein
MTRTTCGWLLAGVLTMTACRGGERPVETENAAAGEAAGGHAEEADAIHLSEDMVRDLRISTARVSERAGTLEAAVLGELVADQDRYAEVAPSTGGSVLRVLVDSNSAVRPGTPLAQLRSAEVGRARAALITATARRDLARQTLDRKQALAGERIVAMREVQEAEAAFRAADAEARAAATLLRALGVVETAEGGDASLFTVNAPIAGRVIDRRAVIGQYADPQTTLFTIADLSRIWLVAQAFERDAVNVTEGSVAHVTLPALPGREIDGRVTLVGRQVEPDSRTVAIRVELPNPGGVLRPGMSANVRIEVGGQDARILAVPAAALQRVGQQWLAFVPVDAQEFQMRPVGRGRDLGNEVEVVSGLKANETVVVEGAFLLKAEAEKRLGGGDEHGH